MKIVKLDPKYYYKGSYAHWCPACGESHIFTVEEPFGNGAKWTFNGNHEKPSFSPSMKISWEHPKGQTKQCHYFITDGKIIYCSDSTHNMAGQTVDLPDLPPHVHVSSQLLARKQEPPRES